MLLIPNGNRYVRSGFSNRSYLIPLFFLLYFHDTFLFPDSEDIVLGNYRLSTTQFNNFISPFPSFQRRVLEHRSFISFVGPISIPYNFQLGFDETENPSRPPTLMIGSAYGYGLRLSSVGVLHFHNRQNIITPI